LLFPDIYRSKNKLDNLNTYVYTNLDRLVALKYDIRGFSYLPKQPVQSQLTGKHRSLLRGRGLDFEEVRNYYFGDDIRSIDWKVTARTKKPHTKVYTEERERPVFLLIDQSSSMFFGSQQFMKSVVAAEAAAISAWKVLAVGDRIGGIVFDDDSWEEVKPKRSSKAVLQFLNSIIKKNNLLKSSHVGNQTGNIINIVLEQTLRFVTHNYLVVIFSDFYGADNQTIKLLKQISRHNDLIAGIIVDEMEKEIDSGAIIGDGGQQINLSEVNADQKVKYKLNRQKNLKEFKETLYNYRITPLEFNTNETILDQIRNMLGGRRL
jgi:uncharacterized protein (DUF58 family)